MFAMLNDVSIFQHQLIVNEALLTLFVFIFVRFSFIIELIDCWVIAIIIFMS